MACAYDALKTIHLFHSKKKTPNIPTKVVPGHKRRQENPNEIAKSNANKYVTILLR